MDVLKAQIAAQKRKADAAPPPGKYMRRGELERQEEEARQAEAARQAEERRAAEASRTDATQRRTSAGDAKRSASPAATPPTTASPDPSESRFQVSNEEAVRRLRQKGEPIRLFAESNRERLLRLRALELIEQRGDSHGHNEFMRALLGTESGLALEQIERRSATEKGSDAKASEREAEPSSRTPPRQREGIGMDSVLDLGLIRRDISRVYPMIYYTLKGLLSDWAEALAKRPEDARHSSQGRLVSATQMQTAENLKPLFKRLRRRELDADVLMRVAEIVHFVQRREYRQANDSYLQLSIGNAPWPIGVTMPGIHERSNQEKIFSSNVAHVLNDEVSRKYIQGLKRLMTFAQSQYPPADISKLMG